MPSSCKDIVIRKFEFEESNQSPKLKNEKFQLKF